MQVREAQKKRVTAVLVSPSSNPCFAGGPSKAEPDDEATSERIERQQPERYDF